jgi:xyloglucan-specific exo-beta-1,4-glucanase
VFDNTNTLDYAALKPNVLVRSGAQHKGADPTLGYSEDFGRTWSPLVAPRAPGDPILSIDADGPGRDPYRDAAIIVSADGAALMVMTSTPVITRDRGQSWRPVRGLPRFGRPVADRADPLRFYALDFDTRDMLVSTDAGANFSRFATRGLPADIRPDRPTWREDAWPLRATPGRAGELWFVSRSGLYHSRDGGRIFVRIDSPLAVEMLDFGKAAPGREHPALFAVGTRDGLRAIWRSDDVGRSWIRVNDPRHEYGRTFRCIAGDPRVFGRVYVGTDGRGIVYGEPALGADRS